MSLTTVKVETVSHQYPVYLFSDVSQHEFAHVFTNEQVIVITQSTVLDVHPQFLSRLFKTTDISLVLLPDGEKYKNIETYQWLMGELIKLKCHRNTLLVAWGGGVVGDIAGFAASTFYRGIPFIQIPTTLIAQVDSSVGGKTGVNHQHVKNAIGTFYQPQAVLIDVQFLATLPQREFIAGLAEVIKYGVIADADFFVWLESNIVAILNREEAALLYMLERCVRLKASIVSLDEQEKSGLRQVLNFGHTFGHALESYFNYEYLLHGEAVALGMWLASELSYDMAELDRNSVLRIQSLLKQAQLIRADFKMPEASLWMSIMASDKKKMGSLYQFILLKRIGEAFSTNLSSLALIDQVINRFNSSIN